LAKNHKKIHQKLPIDRNSPKITKNSPKISQSSPKIDKNLANHQKSPKI